MDAWLNENVETEEYRDRVRSVALGLGDLRACELADLEKALNLKKWPYLARIRFSKAWDDLQSAEETDDDDDLTVPYIDKSERRPKKKQMTPREYDALVAANASAATSRRRGGRPPARDAPRRLFTDLVDVGKSYVDLEDPEQQQRAAKRARRG